MIEAVTYRHGGHSRADPAKYRPSEEVSRWLSRDPVELYRKRLTELLGTDQELVGIEAVVNHSVDTAVEEAKGGERADTSLVSADVWADGGSAWRN